MDIPPAQYWTSREIVITGVIGILVGTLAIIGTLTSIYFMALRNQQDAIKEVTPLLPYHLSAPIANDLQSIMLRHKAQIPKLEITCAPDDEVLPLGKQIRNIVQSAGVKVDLVIPTGIGGVDSVNIILTSRQSSMASAVELKKLFMRVGLKTRVQQEVLPETNDYAIRMIILYN